MKYFRQSEASAAISKKSSFGEMEDFSAASTTQTKTSFYNPGRLNIRF
jgi:hypothetical protein